MIRDCSYLEFCFSSLLDGRQGLVWILGHSYVFLGAKRGDIRPEGRQLGISRRKACIRWLGVPGMLWSRVVPEVHKFALWDRRNSG